PRGIDWTTVATPAQNATFSSDTNLMDGSTYYYRIRSVGPNGPAYSRFGSVASGTTYVAPISDLVASPLSSGIVNLSWSDVTTVSSRIYVVQRWNETTYVTI